MNNKILKQHKIDERYVLSERKFLYTFGYLCLEDELIKNGAMTKKQLYYFLKQRLNHASEEEIDLASVATGKIILVGRPNNFCAYYRPIEIIKEATDYNDLEENKRVENHSKRINPLTQISLSELLQLYYENILNDDSMVYLEEILLRTNMEKSYESQLLDRKYKNKIKCYKQNLKSNLDKRYKRDKI